MDRFFDANNPLMRFLSWLVDLVIINVLTIVCAVPIVTVGASFTAMNYVLLHKARDNETYIGKMFFHSFRDNLKQGILCGLIYLVIGLIAGVDLYVLHIFDMKATTALMIILSVVSCFIFVTAVYVFGLLARYENTVSGTFRNAIQLTIAHLPLTLVMIVIWMAWLFVLWYFPKTTVLLFLLFGFSLPGFLCALLYDPVFRKMEETE